jgi:hypothetical protein
MIRYGEEPREPTPSGESGGDWVDFPASPEPDAWAALLREANQLPRDVFRAGRTARQVARRSQSADMMMVDNFA